MLQCYNDYVRVDHVIKQQISEDLEIPNDAIVCFGQRFIVAPVLLDNAGRLS